MSGNEAMSHFCTWAQSFSRRPPLPSGRQGTRMTALLIAELMEDHGGILLLGGGYLLFGHWGEHDIGAHGIVLAAVGALDLVHHEVDVEMAVGTAGTMQVDADLGALPLDPTM